MLNARIAISLVLLGAGLGACAGDRHARAADPLTASRQADLTVPERLEAIRGAKADVAAGRLDPRLLRVSMKELAWSLDTPEPVRAAALEAILWDETDPADSTALVKEMLPTEPDRQAVAVMATAAADHGWVETTPALVRSLARPVVGVADPERAEYQALRRLHPQTPIDQVALAVFLDPQTDPGPGGLHLDMRVREAAWTLLGRLSPDPSARGRLLDEAPAGDEEGGAILADLRLVRDELGAVPANGEELRWAIRLCEAREGDLGAWWEQAGRAVASSGSGPAVSMRHLEPARWAGENRPEWVRADRAALLDELSGRLRGRQTLARTESVRGTATATSERLSGAIDLLEWGDALALLVIDTALAEPGVAGAFFEAADVDHKDQTTEHGGMLWSDARGFHVQSFAPRGSAAPDDRRFTAPREMIDYSSASLAHFHFHVSQTRNRDYAGPSPEDLDYAARFGRTCLVLTSTGPDSLDADVYFPSGAVVDLGEIRRPSDRPWPT